MYSSLSPQAYLPGLLASAKNTLWLGFYCVLITVTLSILPAVCFAYDITDRVQTEDITLESATVRIIAAEYNGRRYALREFLDHYLGTPVAAFIAYRRLIMGEAKTRLFVAAFDTYIKDNVEEKLVLTEFFVQKDGETESTPKLGPFLI